MSSLEKQRGHPVTASEASADIRMVLIFRPGGQSLHGSASFLIQNQIQPQRAFVPSAIILHTLTERPTVTKPNITVVGSSLD